MKTLVLANHKGGVGKSAVASLLAHYFAQHGQRVLAIDLDHQGNFSAPLRRSGRPNVATVSAEMLLKEPANAVPSDAFTLVPAGPGLMDLERQPELHSSFANGLRAFLHSIDRDFDVCVIDTHPNPDIRLIAALASSDFVLSPIQLYQEALEGVHALLNHPRAGIRKLKSLFTPTLQFIGLLPVMVEATPLQKANFVTLVQRYSSLMIPIGSAPGNFARVPRRSAIADAQAEGAVLWEVKKTAARQTWAEIEPGIRHIAGIVTAGGTDDAAA